MKKILTIAIAISSIAFTAYSQNTWTQKTDFGGASRYGPVGFSIGDKGYMGTGWNGSYKNDFWEYDPIADAWAQKANVGTAGREMAVGFSIGTKGYIGTGNNANGGKRRDFWEYDQSSNTWTQKADFGGTARWGARGFSVGDKGYIGTGEDNVGSTKDFWEYNPATDTWTEKTEFAGLARSGGVGFSVGSKGYFGSGGNGSDSFNDFWEYDPLSDSWTEKADFPGVARGSSSAFSIGAKAYFGLGTVSNIYFQNDFWEFDPSNDTWTQMPDFEGAARDVAASFAIGSKGYIGSGRRVDATFSKDFWQFTPPCITGDTIYLDADADGYGDSNNSIVADSCDLPAGYSLNNTDCNDANSSIHPNLSETTGDGIDNNCNGVVDENNALSFDGVNDYVIATRPVQNDFTIEAWIKTSATSLTGSQYFQGNGLIYADVVGELSDFGTSILNNKFCFGVGGTTDVSIQSTSEVTTGNWIHVAAVRFQSTAIIQVYINGFLESETISTATQPLSNPLNINFGGNTIESRYYNGLIDEIKIWNVARTQSEIQTDMLGATCGGQSGLVAYYNFNQGIASGTNTSETTLDDLTSNNNNGTLTNFALTGSTSNWVEGVPGLSDSATFYLDNDGDGFGDANISVTALACDQPAGYVWDNTDCTDANAAIHPGATELDNCIDDDCDGIVDDGTWTKLTDFGGVARYNAVAFVINGKGYVGTGRDASNNYKKDFWEYDPSTGAWTQKANFGGTKRFKAAGFAIGTKGYIGTGYDVNGSLRNDFWEYDLATNTWSQKADFGGTGRAYAVGFAINGKGYMGTGGDFLAHHNDFWEYDPTTNSWTQKANVGDTLREAAVAFTIGGKGYIGTGDNSSGYKKDFWEYDAASDTWTQKTDFPGTARQAATGFSIGDKGYLGTGWDGTSLHTDFWQYNPATDTWTQKENFPGTERAYAVGFNIGNTGYVATGGGVGTAFKDFYSYDPPTTGDVVVYADADSDGYGDASVSQVVTNCNIPQGYVLDSTDCDDSNSSIHPGAADLCNGIDDNCDGVIDPVTDYYVDADNDGYGDANNSVSSCTPVNGYVTDNTDCDDNDAAINPGVTEICNNLDDNCNGSIDEGVLTTYYADADGDEYGDANESVSSCTPIAGYVTDNTDCDDNDAAINPAATEACNGIDDNCNGSIDDGLVFTTYYADADQDSFGDASNSVSSCAPVSGYVEDNTDCNDNNAAINPSATEVCNYLDDNCDGNIDEGLQTTYYADVDGDSYGDANNSVSSCAPVSGYVTDNTDCNDSNAAINPLATEVCNGTDDNCNGIIDEGLTVTYYVDADDDSYGSSQDAGTPFCSDPGQGYSTNNGDCNDANASINPLATEVCNSIDDNCNGSVDDGLVLVTYYLDADGDTYGNPNIVTIACAQPNGYVPDNTDCDDSNPNVNPGATEIPNNGIDDNCNGEIDEFGVGISSLNTASNQLSVFPNPTDGKFVIELELRDAITGEATIEVINLLGQIMQSQKVAMVKGKLQQKIQFSKEEAEGMYLVKVTIGDKIFTAQIDLQK